MNALLIDGLNMIRRVFPGVPEIPGDDKNYIDSLLRSMRASINRAIRRHFPTHVVFVNDSDTPSWRHELFAEYKKGRTPMPQLLRDNLDNITEQLSALGIGSIKVDGFEADDIIATLATGIAERGGRAIILSTDHSFCQLMQEDIIIFDHFQNRVMGHEYVVDKFGVDPDALRDLFALTGIPSLNITGVTGIGAKTASELLAQYGTLDALLQAAEKGASDIPPKLLAEKEAALLAYQLVGMRTDVQLGINLKDLQYTRIRRPSYADSYHR